MNFVSLLPFYDYVRVSLRVNVSTIHFTMVYLLINKNVLLIGPTHEISRSGYLITDDIVVHHKRQKTLQQPFKHKRHRYRYLASLPVTL